jgi:hypothetical protein
MLKFLRKLNKKTDMQPVQQGVTADNVKLSKRLCCMTLHFRSNSYALNSSIPVDNLYQFPAEKTKTYTRLLKKQVKGFES